MVHRLRRFLLPITCVCVLAGAALPAGAAAKAAVGISDNGAGMFSSSLFNRLNITTARLVVPWNAAVLRNRSQLNAARAWIRAAEAHGVQPLISFGGQGGAAGNYIPPTSVYTAAIKAFLRNFPEIKLYTPWNEPDWVYRPKLANNPRLAASYFNSLVRWCRGCTVAAGDLYLPNPQLGRWIRAYRRYLSVRPKAWALHNYYDVRTHGAGQIRTLQSLTSGQIWLTEIGGVERRGHWQFANQSVFAAARDESFLFSLPRSFPRVTRIYHFEWQGTFDGPHTGWDSGLIGPLGRPRPAYWTVAKAAGLRQKPRPRKRK